MYLLNKTELKNSQFKISKLSGIIYLATCSIWFIATTSFAADAATKPVVAATPAMVTPKAELTAEVVYDYLLAEIAAQRGEYGISSHLFLGLAKSTRDPSLAERAVKAAALGNQGNLALEASKTWEELDPNSLEAEQAASQLLIASGNLNDAKPHLAKLLAKQETRANGFLAINSLFARQPDKKLVQSVITDLAKPYPDLPEAHFAIAHAAFNANDLVVMQTELDIAEKLRPGWEVPPIMRAQLLQKESADKAIASYRDFLKKYPKANDVRLALAKLLVNQKHSDEAKPELVQLSKAANGNPEIHVVLGLLAIEAKDYSAADNYLQQSLKNGFKDPEQIYIYLGKLADQQKNTKQALAWFDKVKLGEHYLEAKTAAANVIARTKGTDSAIKMLDQLQNLTSEQQTIVVETQASLLALAKRNQESFDLLDKALKNMVNTPDLVFEYASAAERIGKYDLMESELNKVIATKPDYAPAYNALGYSLADRNIKLDLAKELIDKALAITPDDHFMIDSLGWVYYRQGKLDLAVEQLRRAYNVQADPEIAAHLGEVLWQQGKKDEAKSIWQGALKENPDNEVLLSTTKKFIS